METATIWRSADGGVVQPRLPNSVSSVIPFLHLFARRNITLPSLQTPFMNFFISTHINISKSRVVLGCCTSTISRYVRTSQRHHVQHERNTRDINKQELATRLLAATK